MTNINNTVDVLREVLTNNCQITEIVFKEFSSSKPIQERIKFENHEIAVLNRALAMREEYKVPFWDSLLTNYITGEFFSRDILTEAFKHNKFLSEHRLNINKPDDVKLFLERKEGLNLAISSLVKLNSGDSAHIPMLDFHCFPGKKSIQTIEQILRTINSGNRYILESGKSFHFIGMDLLSISEFTNFLAKALLYSPIIDRAWISHQLLEKACALRVGQKNGFVPNVVRFFNS